MYMLFTAIVIALSSVHLFAENKMTEENTTSNEIYYLSSSRLVQAMKSGELSALEVMEQHLNRIEKMNPVLNGLVQQLPREECLRQALEADQKRIKGLALGKLHGLPITVKDAHLVKGFASCVGCTGLTNKVAEIDSTIIARLKEEGAIVIGLTNVPNSYLLTKQTTMSTAAPIIPTT